jgi:hypothetical protein
MSLIVELKKDHIRLNYEDDSLFWVFNEVRGEYLENIGYKAENFLTGSDTKRWWNKLWKTIAHLKEIILMLISLNEKGLTWDQLVKSGEEGLEVCMFCR